MKTKTKCGVRKKNWIHTWSSQINAHYTCLLVLPNYDGGNSPKATCNVSRGRKWGWREKWEEKESKNSSVVDSLGDNKVKPIREKWIKRKGSDSKIVTHIFTVFNYCQLSWVTAAAITRTRRKTNTFSYRFNTSVTLTQRIQIVLHLLRRLIMHFLASVNTRTVSIDNTSKQLWHKQ